MKPTENNNEIKEYIPSDTLMEKERAAQPRENDRFLMIALRGIVALPLVTLSFDVVRDRSVAALTRAVDRNEKIFLVAQKHISTDKPAPKDICRVGCVCKIKQVLKLPNNVTRVMVEGVKRARIVSYLSINPYFEVETENFEDRPSEPLKLNALEKMISKNFEEFSEKFPPELEAKFEKPYASDEFCYNCFELVSDNSPEKQDLLETDTLEDRLQKLLIAMSRKLELMRIEKKIAEKVRKSLDQSQKEYYLREQAKAIHEELGDGEEELDDYLKAAKKLPEEPRKKVEKEVSRMQRMSPTSPEAGVSRSYIEWLLEVPWTAKTEDNTDLSQAKKILDEDHFGLEKVKERILEYIAVMTLTKKIKGPILCFVGPPGVGKTSIVRSIARALNRKFISMSLGGVRDEAEIRGHRRTYIGAIPGGIVYHIKQAGTVNPVFLLDEIDKMDSDFRGDPTSAMLEVLDPEQNHHFRDHYLEVAYDLSQVMFVTTANSLKSIPAPLLDRMEVIELSGYTEDEKTQIAEKYLIGKQCEANGLKDVDVAFTDEAVRKIITQYTGEGGVRNLERNIGTICRKIACKIVEGDQSKRFEIAEKEVEEYLGVPKYLGDELNDKDEIGEATGLAWTSLGGVTLPVEVALIEGGKGELILTGQLGDVMKESARAAVSVVRTLANEYGIAQKRFDEVNIHVHVPEGATPKDGPSAGITMATAIMSAFSGRAVDHLTAMTGEITLRGKVTPIGGLKEKLIAAERLGIRQVIIPKKNEKDLADIPESVKRKLTIVSVSDVKEVFGLALKD